MNKISIIIAILNEYHFISRLLTHLKHSISNDIDYEIIVVDGGSTDDSLTEILKHQHIIFAQSEKSRSKQLNMGAELASGNIFYFLHCDSFPPKHFDKLILNEVKRGNLAGCFRLKFDVWHPVLQVSQWFTRVNHISCRGGDQSLYITSDLFQRIGRYDEKYIVYEDNEICRRLYNEKQFRVIPKYLITSARKYIKNGVCRLQYHFAVIHLKNKLGHSPESMLEYYRRNVV